MKYYKVGNSIIATTGILDYPEITKEEYEAEMKAVNERMQVVAEQMENLPTESERLEALESAFMEFVGVMMGG